ncbi:MAG: 23S rRNA (uracil(1939)-C(5))-methyltransferase RlmD [Bacteroidetes bacterium]|nr:23S rRNA (uracil(1939)-C(5))-methyltransferase RlmD [Bacteroidota bacterium]
MAKRKKFVIKTLPIEAYAAEGKCIARQDDKIIFVEGAVPGDIADVFVYRNKKDWAEARVNTITTFSPNRVDAFCQHFSICGGCKWQMLPYELQLQYKEQQVKDQLQRIGKVHIGTYLPIKGCAENTLYRNKLEFTFSNKQYLSNAQLQSDMNFDKNVVGFHAPKLFDKVIDIEKCYLQAEPTNAIRNFIREFATEHQYSFYDIRAHVGLLRTLIIRISKAGQCMVNLVFGEDDQSNIDKMMQAILQNFPDITSLHYTINTKLNDTIYDQQVICYAGKEYIEERLEEFVFRISPKSFFQTNSKQAEVLYQTVREFAGATGNEILYDLYCGTGSIGIFLSKQVKKVIGVDTVEDAITDAKLNATVNGLHNAEFFAGDVIKVCNTNFFTENGTPDIVIIDPPRAGCHDTLLQKLLDIKAPRMVYVSCNPATQARDLQQLSLHYEISKSQAVDMFPHTHHIENVVQLNLKEVGIE